MSAKILPPEELNKVIRFCREQLDAGTTAEQRDACGILLGTLGLRIGETTRLTVGDVGVHKQILHVDTLKGGKPRDLPLDRRLHQALLGLGTGRTGSQPLLSTRTGRSIDPRNLRRRWSTWCREALGAAARFHDLRHSFAHFVYAQDRDIFAVQRLMGHRKIETTHLYLVSLQQLAPFLPGADKE